MSNSIQRSRLARDTRWYPVVAVAPYVILAVLVGFTIAIKHSAGVSLLIDLALCALAAVWMLWMFTLHPAWQVRPGVMAIFVAGLIVIMAVLVVRDPWFGAFAIAGYIYVFAVIPWPWQLLGLSALAVLAATAQASGIAKDTPFGLTAYLVLVAVNVLAICAFAAIYWSSVAQSDQRRQALDAVSEANRRLESTLVENAALQEQLLAQARMAGTLDERQRMAREIHDTLAQGLIGIITQLQAAEQSVADGSVADLAEQRRHLDAAVSLARESLSDARRSVLALQPGPLEGARLGEALAGVADRWSTRQGTAVVVTATGSPHDIAVDAETALLRTAQEALANVARHARAHTVWLTLSYLDGEVALDVRDDGEGFDPSAPGEAPDGGFGLVAMRQRVEGLSGSLQVESAPGAGTTVSARIPCAPAGVLS